MSLYYDINQLKLLKTCRLDFSATRDASNYGHPKTCKNIAESLQGAKYLQTFSINYTKYAIDSVVRVVLRYSGLKDESFQELSELWGRKSLQALYLHADSQGFSNYPNTLTDAVFKYICQGTKSLKSLQTLSLEFPW